MVSKRKLKAIDAKVDKFVLSDRMIRAAEALNLAIEKNMVFTDKQWTQFGSIVQDDKRLTKFMGQLRLK